MHFVFGRDTEGRVTVEEAGDGSDEQHFAVSHFLEQLPGGTLLRFADNVRRLDEVKDEDGEWGASTNLIGVNVNSDRVILQNLFADEQMVEMGHQEFVELVDAYVQALRDAGDPRAPLG